MKVKLLNEEFKGERTAYSSPSIFIAILTNDGDVYDHEEIGKTIMDGPFGCINPPGPSFGFGCIMLREEEENGIITIESLKNRSDDEGNPVTPESLKESLEEYFDAFFVVDQGNKLIEQIEFSTFYKHIASDSDYKLIHFCEFEPEEDCEEEEDD